MSLEAVSKLVAKWPHEDMRGLAMETPTTERPCSTFCRRCELAAALVAEGQGDATINELKARLKEAQSEFAIQARACGNWREWPEKIVSTEVPDWTHEDWKAATRAIMERDELRAAAPSPHKEGARPIVHYANPCEREDCRAMREELDELCAYNLASQAATITSDPPAALHKEGAGGEPILEMSDTDILVWYEQLEEATTNTGKPEEGIIAHVRALLHKQSTLERQVLKMESLYQEIKRHEAEAGTERASPAGRAEQEQK